MDESTLINLPIDCGFAFDFLSILETKKYRIDDEKNEQNYNYYKKVIKDQIDVKFPDKFGAVMGSDEYKALFMTNLEIFDIIEQQRSGKKRPLKVADDLNLRRFDLKKQIMAKFFGGEVIETKTQIKRAKKRANYAGA